MKEEIMHELQTIAFKLGKDLVTGAFVGNGNDFCIHVDEEGTGSIWISHTYDKANVMNSVNKIITLFEENGYNTDFHTKKLTEIICKYQINFYIK